MTKNRGVTFGAFDLLHAGHAIFLHSCRNHCEELIVGLHVDPSIERIQKNKPIQSVTERYFQLEPYADIIIPYETERDLWNIVASINDLDYYFVGSDYQPKDWVPPVLKEIIEQRDIMVKYIDRYHNYSSTELRKRVYNNEKAARNN